MTAGCTDVGLDPLVVFEAAALLEEVVKESGVFDMADSSWSLYTDSITPPPVELEPPPRLVSRVEVRRAA